MRLVTAAGVIAILASLAAGGQWFLVAQTGSSATDLTPRDAQKVSVFEANLSVLTSLDDRIPSPTYGEVVESMNKVIVLARSNPDALYTNGHRRQTLRRVLIDAALALTPYERRLSAKLLRAIEKPQE